MGTQATTHPKPKKLQARSPQRSQCLSRLVFPGFLFALYNFLAINKAGILSLECEQPWPVCHRVHPPCPLSLPYLGGTGLYRPRANIWATEPAFGSRSSEI
jgi:hypothetical protein